jgi:hypothetical protein
MEKKKKTKKEETVSFTLEEATTYLKKMGEWESVWNMERETIIKWAEFLLVREERKKYEDYCNTGCAPKSKQGKKNTG